MKDTYTKQEVQGIIDDIIKNELTTWTSYAYGKGGHDPNLTGAGHLTIKDIQAEAWESIDERVFGVKPAIRTKTVHEREMTP